MVECIMEAKSLIIELVPSEKRKPFLQNFWDSVENFVFSTKPVFILTKEFQEEALICGSFFLYWKECVLELEEINTPLARQYKIALVKHLWLNNDSFLASVYVDLRLQALNPPLLSIEQKERAIVCILF